jgi:hypothetical protein
VSGPLRGCVAPTPNGAFAKVELAFQLPDDHGNPFDYVENDVQATLRLPGRPKRDRARIF